MPAGPAGVTGDQTDPLGTPGSAGFPTNAFASMTPTVLVNGRPMLALGAIAAPHGNYTDPKMPGFNPPCACSLLAINCVSTILVNGQPAAVVGTGSGSQAACGHWLAGPGVPTVILSGL